MRLSTLVRLAWAGRRADWLRLVFTAVGAGLGAVAMLAAATVYWLPATEVITPYPGGGAWIEARHRYTTDVLNSTMVRPWFAAALMLLALPALVFAAQSSRLGAPARDRRLMAIRLAGATPGQLRLIAMGEAVVACLLGALAGVGAYFAIRRLAPGPVLYDGGSDYPGPRWGDDDVMRLPLPTDALPPRWVFAAVLVVIPVLAAGLTAIALRRLTVTPLAVTRRPRVKGLRWWPLAAIAAGFGVLGLHQVLGRIDFGDKDLTLPLSAWGAVILLSVGVALCAVPLGQLTARIALRYLRSAAPQLAARWIIADPWSGSRSLAVTLVAVFGAAAAIEGISYGRSIGMTGWSHESGMQRFAVLMLAIILLVAAAGLLFAIVEGLLTRRRALASLAAAGAPVAVLARAVLWQALLPTVPAVVLAIVVGHQAMVTAQTLASPDPIWAQLTLGVGAIAGIAAAAALSLIVLRSSVKVTELRVE
jgi:hypothetical protein